MNFYFPNLKCLLLLQSKRNKKLAVNENIKSVYFRFIKTIHTSKFNPYHDKVFIHQITLLHKLL